MTGLSPPFSQESTSESEINNQYTAPVEQRASTVVILLLHYLDLMELERLLAAGAAGVYVFESGPVARELYGCTLRSHTASLCSHVHFPVRTILSSTVLRLTLHSRATPSKDRSGVDFVYCWKE